MTDISAASPSVTEMLRGYSIEVNPGESKIVDAAPDRLDKGTEVFLTWIPGTDPMTIVPAAAKLRRGGLFPTPHIGARHVESAAQLSDLAARFVDAGVDRVLIIAGDRDKPAGPYDSSLAVMQSGLLQKAGIVRTAVGGFPEGNPNISDPVLAQALTAKVDFARSAGLQLSIVTQFCFEADPIVEWVRRIRSQGIDVPVRVGLAGPAGLIALTRYAIRCGVGNSVKVLTEKPAFAKLLIDKGPEPIIREVATGIGPGSGPGLPLGVAGLHFFVFGGFNKTVDWINATRSN
ncbi:MAG TPA: methylenetetrahydrofolate reductase [Candidatus Acidoferrales bacterium]|nr:methylenetetrahydrofolate reductase [Candidatus Acidoferrales bacterium]